MDVDVFEKKLKALNLGLLLAPAEKDVMVIIRYK